MARVVAAARRRIKRRGSAAPAGDRFAADRRRRRTLGFPPGRERALARASKTERRPGRWSPAGLRGVMPRAGAGVIPSVESAPRTERGLFATGLTNCPQLPPRNLKAALKLFLANLPAVYCERDSSGRFGVGGAAVCSVRPNARVAAAFGFASGLDRFALPRGPCGHWGEGGAAWPGEEGGDSQKAGPPSPVTGSGRQPSGLYSQASPSRLWRRAFCPSRRPLPTFSAS